MKTNLLHVHRSLELIIMVKMTTNSPCLKSVVLESSVQPSLGKQAWFDRGFKNHWLRWRPSYIVGHPFWAMLIKKCPLLAAHQEGWKVVRTTDQGRFALDWFGKIKSH